MFRPLTSQGPHTPELSQSVRPANNVPALVVVVAASVHDNQVGNALLDKVAVTAPTVTKAWVDAGFKDELSGLAICRETALTLGYSEPDDVVDATIAQPAHRQILAEFERADGGLRAGRRLRRAPTACT
jgi:hypothetical protein